MKVMGNAIIISPAISALYTIVVYAEKFLQPRLRCAADDLGIRYPFFNPAVAGYRVGVCNG